MLRRVLTGAVLAALAVAAWSQVASAQEDPIKARRDIMKGVGQAARTGTQFVKGEAPFDLAKAQEIFRVYVAASEKVPNLYPENSKTGGETTASPKVWEDMAEFRKRFASWEDEVKKASAATKDLDTFKASFATVTKACGGCHETFRVKK